MLQSRVDELELELQMFQRRLNEPPAPGKHTDVRQFVLFYLPIGPEFYDSPLTPPSSILPMTYPRFMTGNN